MSILDIIIIILVISWLGGNAFNVGGGLIHILLVIAVIVLILRLLGIKIG
ncbi:lmo0937 family membrane protein [Candidatus Gracilibacteria bacterium]|nr:lmo0937 family membrane protein [Candidatus Gracilibacteria bacterium]